MYKQDSLKQIQQTLRALIKATREICEHDDCTTIILNKQTTLSNMKT